MSTIDPWTPKDMLRSGIVIGCVVAAYGRPLSSSVISSRELPMSRGYQGKKKGASRPPLFESLQKLELPRGLVMSLPYIR